MSTANFKSLITEFKNQLDTSNVLFWFLGAIAFILITCLIYDAAFVSTNEHGLYMDRSGSIVSKACNVYKIKIWMYKYCPFYTRSKLFNFDEDHMTQSRSNKYQILRSSINNEVTTYFNASSPVYPYHTTKDQELQDYKSKFNFISGVPKEYITPNYVIKKFLKFLPHETFREVKQLAQQLNSNDASVDLEKNYFLQEECGICLDSIYLPKNEFNSKYEAKCSSIKLMCGHKFHFSCFIKNTYRTWGNGDMILTENESSVVNKSNDALQSHKDLLRKKLLENIQKQAAVEIRAPPKNKILKDNNQKVVIHSTNSEPDDKEDSSIEKPARNNFNNTSASVSYIDTKALQNKMLIEKTLNSRVDRKCHCALCRLDVELAVAYLRSRDLDVTNCQVI
ncbi:unnamed protein product [Hanseniaspora opuntiae]